MADPTAGMVTLTEPHQDAGTSRSATDAPGADEVTIVENAEAGTYEAVVHGTSVAGVVYSRVGDRVTLLATSVFPEFRGQGYAGRLLGGVLDRLRSEGATATVSCPFVAAFLKDHPEYQDVLDSSAPGTPRRRH